MTPQQIALVQESFETLGASGTDVAAAFYQRLFELAPELRLMFTGDMGEQGGKLMATLAVAVHSLSNIESVIPIAQALGQRHSQYGVLYSHYSVVGAALLWALKKHLGEAFTPEVEEAWMVVYLVLAGAMSEAAETATESNALANPPFAS
jgi:hemoglobin-like flavoprotein